MIVVMGSAEDVCKKKGKKLSVWKSYKLITLCYRISFIFRFWGKNQPQIKQ